MRLFAPSPSPTFPPLQFPERLLAAAEALYAAYVPEEVLAAQSDKVSRRPVRCWLARGRVPVL